MGTGQLGSTLRDRFTLWKDAKEPIVKKWLRNVRAYSNTYEKDLLDNLDPDGSRSFIGVTKMKTKTAFGMLVDIYFPGTEEKHWSLSKTPVAESVIPLPEGTDPELVKALIDKQTKGMETLIKDQFTEGRYGIHFRRSLQEFTKLGSGCIKAGYSTIRRKTVVIKGDNGEIGLRVEEDAMPGLASPSIFDIYPEPYAQEIESMVGIYERSVVTYAELLRLRTEDDFKEKAIDKVIEDNPKGNYVPFSHELTLDAISGDTSQLIESCRFEILEYTGDIADPILLELGIVSSFVEQIENSGKDIADTLINVWMIGDVVIKAVFNTMAYKRLPYYIAVYERVAGQLLGDGVPESMQGSQDSVNKAWRVAENNAAAAAKPIYEANNDLLAPGQKNLKIKPGMILWRDGFRGEGNDNALKLLNTPNIIPELMSLIDFSERNIDQETNLPAFTHGQVAPGSASLGRTADGISQVISGAKAVLAGGPVKNIDDDWVVPIVKSFFYWNIEHHEDDSIKGDMQPNAEGSRNLIAKATQLNQAVNLLNITNNELDAPRTDRDYLLRKVAALMNFNPEKAIPGIEAGKGNQDNEPTLEEQAAAAIEQLTVEKLKKDIEEADSRILKNQAAINIDEQILELNKIKAAAAITEKANGIDVGGTDVVAFRPTNRDGIAGNNR